MGLQKLKMNKRGVQLKSAFFAIIVFGLAITAVGIIIDGWSDYYGSGINYDLQGYDKTSSISSTVNEQEQQLSPQSPEIDSNYETNTFRSVYGIVTNILNPFRVVFGNGGMIDNVTERFGIPDYIRIALVTMMISAFLFTLVAIIFRLLRESA